MNEERTQMNLETKIDSVPFRKILVGLAVSEQTSQILKVSAYLAQKLDAKIIACSVSMTATSVQANELDGSPADQEERKTHDNLTEMIHNEFGQDGENIQIKILHGDPAQRISEYAEYAGCDLIIVGSRTHGLLKKALLGSVSSSVASRSKKSVLIVR